MTGLVVSEVFGPTWQGEGPSLGRRAGFIRLGRCNLACTFCDTPYTWRWTDHDPAVELRDRDVADLVAEVVAMDVGLVVVTGGEPLLQQRGLVPLVEALVAHGLEVEVETAGTLAPSPALSSAVTRFNVSPKLANSGNDVEQRWKPDVLRSLQQSGKAAFKFVAVTTADLEEIATIVEVSDLADVWVMPEGTDPVELIARSRELADAVLRRGWHLTTRLHVLLWGDRRGV